jgi:hypothetical protein
MTTPTTLRWPGPVRCGTEAARCEGDNMSAGALPCCSKHGTGTPQATTVASWPPTTSPDRAPAVTITHPCDHYIRSITHAGFTQFASSRSHSSCRHPAPPHPASLSRGCMRGATAAARVTARRDSTSGLEALEAPSADTCSPQRHRPRGRPFHPDSQASATGARTGGSRLPPCAPRSDGRLGLASQANRPTI